LIKDATGRRFLVKFDTLEDPELQTAAGVIVNRIMWTTGYNVPSDHVFVLRTDQLGIEHDATYLDVRKRKQPFTWQNVRQVLRTAPRSADGSYRAFASQFLDGVPKGGFSPDGTRSDDPNDTVSHEHRRELRGLRVLAAWVGHTDIKEDNTLDVYVTENGKRFLRHYLLDFGEALDGHAAEKNRPEDGWEHFVDWEMQTKATLAFGLWQRPWEHIQPTRFRSIGSFTATPFDPKRWREAYPFWPFAEADPSDAYWAARLVMRFDRPLIEAIVKQGRLSDPEAERYLVDTLLARRDAIGRAYLESVTPLDEFRFEGDLLCFSDLGVRYGFARTGTVEWLNGSRVAFSAEMPARGRLCVRPRAHDDYSLYRLRVRRGASTRPPMEIHFKGGMRPRLLGIVRVSG